MSGHKMPLTTIRKLAQSTADCYGNKCSIQSLIIFTAIQPYLLTSFSLFFMQNNPIWFNNSLLLASDAKVSALHIVLEIAYCKCIIY